MFPDVNSTLDRMNPRFPLMKISNTVWLVVWNIFPYIGNNNPISLIFFRGIPPTSSKSKPKDVETGKDSHAKGLAIASGKLTRCY